MKTNSRFILSLGFCVTLMSVLSCTSVNEGASSAGASAVPAQAGATLDQTATIAFEIIEAALSATPIPPTRGSDMGASAPDTDATKTVEAQNVAAAVAATLTAQPVATPTPDLAATQTREAQRVATVIAATLTAQPTSTPDLVATQTGQAHFVETVVAATLTAQPSVTATNTPAALHQVVAYRADEQTLQGLNSLWSLASFHDLYAPGIQTYNVSITPNQK